MQHHRPRPTPHRRASHLLGLVRRASLCALLCALGVGLGACKSDAPETPPTDPSALAPAPPEPGPAAQKRPRGAFKPEKLRCAALLGPAAIHAILGITPELVERSNRRDGETTVVCASKNALPSQSVSYQVSCGPKRAPAHYQALRAIHEKALGAEALPSQTGVVTPSSYLALHPYRPCFVQLTSRAAAQQAGAMARLGAALSATLP